MPGSFVGSMTSPDMTREQVQRIHELWGLNEPLWRQYLRFMFNYQVGNFGWSPVWRTSVWSLIERRLPRTVILFGATTIVAYIVGPLIGMYLGWWRGSRRDQAAFTGGLLAYSMPTFWVAWLMIWLFKYELGWFPSRYLRTQFPSFEWTAVTVMTDVLWHLALPILSIGVVGWVGAMLVMRTTMHNQTDAGYVLLARAKGLSERTVMVKHAARNALIPVATEAIVGIAFILDGAVIIENVFNYPGMGQLLVEGVLRRDFPTIQAIFFLLSVLIVAMRLLTDVAYTYLDPRIKFGGDG
jgi:peptide/nickel transport system permease protein